MARTHVVMANEVMEAMDRLVGKRGRSRFLEEAAREKLARIELESALKETAGALPIAYHPEWRDRASTAAWVRNVRRTAACSPRLTQRCARVRFDCQDPISGPKRTACGDTCRGSATAADKPPRGRSRDRAP